MNLSVKEFKNLSTFGKAMGKIVMAFFLTQCRICCTLHQGVVLVCCIAAATLYFEKCSKCQFH